MPGPKPIPLSLSDCQQKILEKIVKRHRTPQQLSKRIRLILLMAEGKNNQQAAREIEVHQKTAKRWRQRWLESVGILTSVEMNSEDEKEIEKLMMEILTDFPRDGAPVKFTAEQVTQILALACEEPSLSNRPINNWTLRELVDEAKSRGIVTNISRRTVGRFLKRRRNQTAQGGILV